MVIHWCHRAGRSAIRVVRGDAPERLRAVAGRDVEIVVPGSQRVIDANDAAVEVAGHVLTVSHDAAGFLTTCRCASHRISSSGCTASRIRGVGRTASAACGSIRRTRFRAVIRQPHLVLPERIGVIVQAVQLCDRDIVELVEGFHRRIQQCHLARSIALRVRHLLVDELLQRIGEEALAGIVQVQAFDGVFLNGWIRWIDLRRRRSVLRALRVQHLHADVHDVRVVLLRDRAERLRILIREAELRARQRLAGDERDHRALPVLLAQPAEHRLIPGRELRRIIRHSQAHDREVVLILPERMGHRVVPALRRDRPVLRYLCATVPDHLRQHRRRRAIRLLPKRRPRPEATIPLRQRNIRQLHRHAVLHRERRLQPLCPGTRRLRRTHPGPIAVTDHQHTHWQLVLQPLIEAVVQLPLERKQLLIREPLLRRLIEHLLIFRARPRLVRRLRLPVMVEHDPRRAHDQHRQHDPAGLQQPRIHRTTLITSHQNETSPDRANASVIDIVVFRPCTAPGESAEPTCLYPFSSLILAQTPHERN